MNKKPKILFAIPTLYAGGAERVVSFLAQNINSDSFESHLLIAGYSCKATYDYDPVRTTFLEKSRVRASIPSVIKFLIKETPDIVFSTLDFNTVFGILAPLFPGVKFVFRIPNILSVIGEYSSGSKIHGLLAKYAFRNADSIVCQSTNMAIDFKRMYGHSSNKIIIINNPITNLFPLKSISKTESIIKFITIGRLSPEKGYLRIIEILSEVKFKFHYTIIGSGPEENTIKKALEDFNLTNCVTHIPFTKSVGEQLANHDLFLQGSYVEGFPNAVLESIVTGTPVLAFEEPGGTNEIIVQGINGFMVRDKHEFKKKLEEINELNLNPIQVRNSVIHKFGKDNILKQYESLFNKVLKINLI